MLFLGSAGTTHPACRSPPQVPRSPQRSVMSSPPHILSNRSWYSYSLSSSFLLMLFYDCAADAAEMTNFMLLCAKGKKTGSENVNLGNSVLQFSKMREMLAFLYSSNAAMLFGVKLIIIFIQQIMIILSCICSLKKLEFAAGCNSSSCSENYLVLEGISNKNGK